MNASLPKARQSLSINFDEMFPGEAILIGSQSVLIRPLSLEQITELTKKLKSLIPIFIEDGITMENFNTPASLLKIIPIVLNNAPLILEEASNIELNSLRSLPIEIIIQIIDKIVEVNLKSKDMLEKNFKSLISKFLQPVPEVQTEKMK